MLRMLTLLVALTTAYWTHANMVVDKIFVDFPAEQPPRQDVSISNPDKQPLYIQVEVLEVTNPGTDDERREVVRDPESIGFIATPSRLTIPPGGRRSVRLVNLDGHGDTERVYRVNLKPVAAPFETDTNVIRVLVGYQLLVFIAPEQTRPGLEGARDGQTLSLHNTGNVNIRLYEGRQCPAGEATPDTSCTAVQGRRLYPGNRTDIALPLDAPVSFLSETAGQRTNRTFE